MNKETKTCPYCGEEILAVAKKCKHCGEWLDESARPTTKVTPATNVNLTADAETIIRQTLAGKYEIISTIGKGGMATVYKAKQVALDRIVALKVIHLNLIHDEEFLKRFRREAELGARLNHPNIVTTYDVGSEGSVNYMAMEYLEGEDLHQIIKKKGRLTVEETVSYISQIAEALDYAHREGLVHRDIKSGNIFITKEGRAVLTDFGIAHAVSGTKLTKTGTVIGTPEYMSPEQADGREIDGRSDLYSLGVVMYECLTGRVPFRAENPLTVINKILTETPPTLTTINSNLPKWIEEITARLLEKDKEKRIQSGSELARLLREKKEISPSLPEIGAEEKTVKIIYDRNQSKNNKNNDESLHDDEMLYHSSDNSFWAVNSTVEFLGKFLLFMVGLYLSQIVVMEIISPTLNVLSVSEITFIVYVVTLSLNIVYNKYIAKGGFYVLIFILSFLEVINIAILFFDPPYYYLYNNIKTWLYYLIWASANITITNIYNRIMMSSNSKTTDKILLKIEPIAKYVLRVFILIVLFSLYKLIYY